MGRHDQRPVTTVDLEHVPLRDAADRLRRAFDLVLRVAAKGNPRVEVENRNEKLERGKSTEG